MISLRSQTTNYLFIHYPNQLSTRLSIISHGGSGNTMYMSVGFTTDYLLYHFPFGHPPSVTRPIRLAGFIHQTSSMLMELRPGCLMEGGGGDSIAPLPPLMSFYIAGVRPHTIHSCTLHTRTYQIQRLKPRMHTTKYRDGNLEYIYQSNTERVT